MREYWFNLGSGEKALDSLGDPLTFKNNMNSLRGADLVSSIGKVNFVKEASKEYIYHVEPEGVTVHYMHLFQSTANIDIIGSRSGISDFKKRLNAKLNNC